MILNVSQTYSGQIQPVRALLLMEMLTPSGVLVITVLEPQK